MGAHDEEGRADGYEKQRHDSQGLRRSYPVCDKGQRQYTHRHQSEIQYEHAHDPAPIAVLRVLDEEAVVQRHPASLEQSNHCQNAQRPHVDRSELREQGEPQQRASGDDAAARQEQPSAAGPDLLPR